MPKNKSEPKHKQAPKHKDIDMHENPLDNQLVDPESSTLVYVNHQPRVMQTAHEDLTEKEKNNLVVLAKKGKLFPTSLTESQIKQQLFLNKVSGRSPGSHASQLEHGGAKKKK